MAMINKKGITLVELVLAMVLAGVILLAAAQFTILHTTYSNTLLKETNLQQEAVSIMNHINSNVRNSLSVNIGENKLDIYGSAGTKTGTYTWSGRQLFYNGAIISDKLNSLTFSDPSGNGQTSLNVVKVDIVTSDTQAEPKELISTVSCRLTPLPVRLVVMDQSGNITLVKGAYDTISSAVTSATNGDTIQISKGTYQEAVSCVGKSLTLLGAYSCKDWSRHLGDANYETIIDGQNIRKNISFTSSSGGQSFAIDGFTIKNGLDPSYSGGIQVRATHANSSITIANNKIMNNGGTYSPRGGGIYASISSSGNINIYNNTITANGVGSNKCYLGGGIYAEASNSGSISICNNNINNNTTASLSASQGGGVWVSTMGAASITILGNIISNNSSATHGGGIYIMQSTGPAYFVISHNNIQGNTAGTTWSYNGYGGGIHIAFSGSPCSGSFIIDNNTISDNISYSNGVGIYYSAFSTTSSLSISNNNITGNIPIPQSNSCTGGGIYIQTASASPVTIASNIIKSNSARTAGGINLSTRSTANLNNNIIALNTSTYGFGGGVECDPFNSSTTIAYNTIAQNSAPTLGKDIYLAPNNSTTIVTNSIIYSSVNGLNGRIVVGGTLNFSNSNINNNTSITIAAGSVTYNNDIYNVNPQFDANYRPQSSQCLNFPGIGGEIGAYGGSPTQAPGIYPVSDDPNTPYIREDIIGRY